MLAAFANRSDRISTAEAIGKAKRTKRGERRECLTAAPRYTTGPNAPGVATGPT